LRRVEESIEHFEIAFASDAEGHVDTMSAEGQDYELAAAEKSLFRRHIHLTLVARRPFETMRPADGRGTWFCGCLGALRPITG
jgi:hypothetical protein